MRAFVGIDLSPEWREALAECARITRDLVPSWRETRWTPPENLHITAVFLGDIDRPAADMLLSGFIDVAHQAVPFTLDLERTVAGAPGGRAPRMLWTVFDDPSGAATVLVKELKSVAEQQGIPVEARAFRPHVTLARARRPTRLGTVPEFADVLAAHLGDTPRHTMSVGEVTLFSSTLSASGARYERIERIPLAAR